MAKRRIALTHRKQRSVLTDMLPFEVPPTFSNRGFYRFLRDHNVEIKGKQVQWNSETDELDAAVRLLFGVSASSSIKTEKLTEWGKTKTLRYVPLKVCEMQTIPFNFQIAHNLDGRTLSVVHPRNQVAVASFYSAYSALIIYYMSVGEFSIRRPVSVSHHAYFNDRLHQENLDTVVGIEEEGKEYEQLGSYFVYKNYRNIHQFFESYEYHLCEKKYDAMVQIDVNKCFDSIYTHSLPWAVIGKPQTKFNISTSKNTFGGRFDVLMQNLNHNETNGIVIGPEFSRIFAEIILQAVDVELMRRLFEDFGLTHKVDYQIFRYVDDYFVFYNSQFTQLKVFETLQSVLKTKKLSINTSKIKHYQKPIITEITIAKDRISTLLNNEISPTVEEAIGSDPEADTNLRLACPINSNRLIIRYKSIIKETYVTYGDLLNYTLAIIENKIDKLFQSYLRCDKELRDRKTLINALLETTEFSFFLYSASPRVNHAIRLCRLITTSVEFVSVNALPYELKHLLYKYVHDNVMQQLEKNSMTSHREVENLYLLISLSQIGREYWLPESVLLRHFLITEDESTHSYKRAEFMSHFSITVLLCYIKDKVRYTKLKAFVEEHIISKLNYMKVHCQNDAEALILFLDLIVCPYISTATKDSLGQIFGLNTATLAAIQGVNDHWFTAWGDKFDLGKELDAKRSREVY